ncbi:MAG: RNA polymerase sigma factor, partial [Planctomycetes bacterium]|nr:RNA polymerase sigma factor [Planctomycetota bacterium]
MDSKAMTIEELLAHAGWVRGLARELVSDAHLAEDVVQQTWLAAMERPPVVRGAEVTWLKRVVRNIAARVHRSRSVRERCEPQGAMREALPEEDATVEWLELQQKLIRHVLQLDEPYRSTVLHRFFLDLTPTEIAARKGIPAGTVRTHLHRALEQLRASLDRESGGRRAEWRGALFPLFEGLP